MICDNPKVILPVDFRGDKLNIKVDDSGTSRRIWICIDDQSVFRARLRGPVTFDVPSDMLPKKNPADFSDPNEVLSRQTTEGDPLMTVLQGAVVRLEDLNEWFNDIINDVPVGTPEQSALEFIDDTRAFIHELQVAGLCREIILKVQRPIETSGGAPEDLLLVYTESRDLEQHITAPPPIWAMFGRDFKMYVKARLWKDGVLQLIARVKDQPW